MYSVRLLLPLGLPDIADDELRLQIDSDRSLLRDELEEALLALNFRNVARDQSQVQEGMDAHEARQARISALAHNLVAESVARGAEIEWHLAYHEARLQLRREEWSEGRLPWLAWGRL